MQHRGFSLVELSIVLVILGLLVGGILAGQSLINAAELRAVVTERDRWITAINSFKGKYLLPPGDMNNATSFWGKDSTLCNGDAGSAVTGGTCNGDGNNIFGFVAVGPYNTREPWTSWQQLGLAGMIEGRMTLPSNFTLDNMSASNGIKSRLGTSIWGLGSGWFEGRSQADQSAIGKNYLCFGKAINPDCQVPPDSNSGIKVQDMWSIDTKIDNGKPTSGKVMAFDQCITSESPIEDAFYDQTDLYRIDEPEKFCGTVIFMVQ